MRYIREFPRSVREIPTLWIPMPDGRRLAARVWLPEDAERDPVPAVLEYLPYRRRDGTTVRDLQTQPWLAGHGYAAIRLDVTGTGDSDGVIGDEYTRREIEDGRDAIAWIAAQPWCNGRVGMWGISWGGINTLQVAALQPPALRAIMPMGFVNDRYNDDCHFMGGSMAEGNSSWGHTFFTENARPPDPESFGPGWKEEWLRRLDALEHPVAIWLSHPHYDDYWKDQSICEDFGRITVPTYAVSGWLDSYSRAVLPLLEKLRGPRKGLIGPWAHNWPQFGHPGPAIGFLQEARRWWDHWLKDVDTGIMDEPMLRVWMMDDIPPSKLVPSWPGRWVAEATWPAARQEGVWHLTGDRTLDEGKAEPFGLPISSPQDTGFAAGYQCSYGIGPDLSDDQREDDRRSLCFDSAPLAAPLEILGEPVIELTVSTDRPQAQIAVRLCSVAPDGSSLRVCYGVLNLANPDGRPRRITPGRPFDIHLPLMGIAQHFPAGHRLRVAISTSYWPILWPAPEQATVTVQAGRLQLPVRAPRADDAALRPFEEPECAEAEALDILRPASTDRPLDEIVRDPVTERVALIRTRDRGAWRTTDTDVSHDEKGEMRFSIHPDDPLSAVQEFDLTSQIGRNGWQTKIDAFTRITSTRDLFRLEARIRVSHEGESVFSRSWDRSIARFGPT